MTPFSRQTVPTSEREGARSAPLPRAGIYLPVGAKGTQRRGKTLQRGILPCQGIRLANVQLPHQAFDAARTMSASWINARLNCTIFPLSNEVTVAVGVVVVVVGVVEAEEEVDSEVDEADVLVEDVVEDALIDVDVDVDVVWDVDVV